MEAVFQALASTTRRKILAYLSNSSMTAGEIAERFERDFVLLRLYTDGPRDTELQQYQLKLAQTVALPTYAIVSPFEPERPLLKVSGVVSADTFVAFLDQGTSFFDARNLAASGE